MFCKRRRSCGGRLNQIKRKRPLSQHVHSSRERLDAVAVINDRKRQYRTISEVKRSETTGSRSWWLMRPRDPLIRCIGLKPRPVQLINRSWQTVPESFGKAATAKAQPPCRASVRGQLAQSWRSKHQAGIRIFCPGKIRSGSFMTSRLASKIFGYSIALP